MVLVRFVVGFALDYALWFGLFSLPDNASYLGSSGLRVVGDSPDYIFVPRFIRPTGGWEFAG